MISPEVVKDYIRSECESIPMDIRVDNEGILMKLPDSPSDSLHDSLNDIGYSFFLNDIGYSFMLYKSPKSSECVIYAVPSDLNHESI